MIVLSLLELRLSQKNSKEKYASSPEDPSSVGWTESQRIVLASEEDPFELVSGKTIAPVEVEYEEYGNLDSDKIVMVCHALSGDAHAAGWDKKAKGGARRWREDKPGWWDAVIGPGKALDSNKYRIICTNVLGSCYGTTGPASINPETGKAYGLAFPVVTVQDWVALQKMFCDALNIKKLFAVVGGSLGGQQVIEWTLAYPDFVEKALIFAAAPRLSAQGLGFNAVGRFAIQNDPNFNSGNYYEGDAPESGLAAARMLAHITYLSDEGMHEKFGRRLQDKEELQFGFDVEFQVESYLNYQGKQFVQRFDANSYLYVTRAMDYYDAAAHWGDGDLHKACERIKSEVMVVGFSTDWLYPPEECKQFALALSQNNKPVTYVDLPSRFGHDAFLVQTDEVSHLMQHFLEAKRR